MIGVIIAVGAAVAFGIGPAFAKPLLAEYPVVTVLATRFTTAALLAWLLATLSGGVAALGRAARGQVRSVGVSASSLVVVAAASYFALALLPATLVILVAYTYPAMVVLVSRGTSKSVPLTIGLASFACAIAGVAFVVGDLRLSDLQVPGLAVAALVPVSTTVFMILLGRLSGDHPGNAPSAAPMPALLVCAGITSVVAVVFIGGAIALGEAPFIVDLSPETLLRITVLGTSAMVAITLSFEAAARVGASVSSLAQSVEIVIVVVTAAVVLGEVVTPIQALGCALVIASLPITTLAARRVATAR